jgi:glyoxylase-like metal-dependent hydrolase (beta-lactamase superfamily II)
MTVSTGMTNPGFRTASHPMMTTTKWDPSAPADRVTSSIWTSAATTDSHLVVTADGDVVINTGFSFAGPRHRERYEEAVGRPLEVRKIVFTQGYQEQIGGWAAFDGPGVETIAHRDHPETLHDQQALSAYFWPRGKRVLHPLIPAELAEGQNLDSRPEVTTYIGDSHAFVVGGRRFDLYSVPGGEATDCIAVWLPDERAVFTGNLMGALYGALPNLYTIRGARLRSARRFIQSVQRVIDLKPELHITGHDEPIFGAQRIRNDLEKIMGAVAYIHDRTIEGMNRGESLWTLMADIRLPEELEPAPGRAPASWCVRTVWEEYVGWCRLESATELYAVPPQAVWPELAELAGGPNMLADRAARHLERDEPLQALHLAEIALSVDQRHRPSLEAQTAALQQLLDHAGNNFDELGFLESEVARSRAVQKEAGSGL